MKANTKSSITLPARELRLVKALKTRLRLKSNVEVVRKGLILLQQTTDRAALARRGAPARVQVGKVEPAVPDRRAQSSPSPAR